MEEDLPAGLSAAEGRRFGLTVGIAFLVLAGIARWRGHPISSLVLAALGSVLVVGGLVIPTLMLPVRDRWMWMAERISRITTPIILGILYFVIITPMGLLLRAVGRSPLTVTRSGDTVWVTRAPTERRGDLRRQF